jgi:hypothetical protein
MPLQRSGGNRPDCRARVTKARKSAGRLGTVTVAVVIALGLAWTGRSSAAATTGRPFKTPKACKLLTTREVSEVLGIKVRAGKPHKLPPQGGLKFDRCDWASTKKGAGGVSGKPLEFNVVVISGSRARSAFEDALIKDMARGIEYHAVPDLGKNAVYEGPTNSSSVLMSDTQLLIVRINPPTFDQSEATIDPEDATVRAATVAVQRIQ